MPGITAIISSHRSKREKLPSAAATLRHLDRHRELPAKGRNLNAVLFHLGVFDHEALAMSPDGRVGLLLDGWVFGYDLAGDNRRACQRMLDDYLQRGISFVKDLNGQFGLLLWDDREDKVFLVSDRFGTRPLYYSQENGELYLAPEGKAVLAASGRPRELDYQAVVNHFSFSRAWLSDTTFFKGVRRLPPATITTWQGGAVTMDTYWRPEYNPVQKVDDRFLDDFVEAFRQANRAWMDKGVKTGMALSGGLDSRSVLAAVGTERRKALPSFNWGVGADNWETLVAREVAETLQSPWRFINLAPRSFLERSSEAVRINEGQDMFSQCYALEVYPQAREEVQVLLMGLAMDLFVGGSHLTAEIVEGPSSWAAAEEYCLRKITYFDPAAYQRLCRFPEAGALREQVAGMVARYLKESPQELAGDALDELFMRFRVGHNLVVRQYLPRCFTEDYYPTLDSAFYQLCLRIPGNERLGHRFYQKFLARLDPRMAKVTYQNTMLPPEAPLKFWKLSQKLEGEREKLYREIYRDTGGEVFIPYRRYYTNFDEWTRSDPAWLAFLSDLFASGQSRLYDFGIDRGEVRNILAAQQRAEAVNFRQIAQLATFELFLRNFFN